MTAIPFEVVASKISELLRRPPLVLRPDTALRSLVIDSFALVELAIGLQEDFDVMFTQDDLKQVTTVGDLVVLVQKKA